MISLADSLGWSHLWLPNWTPDLTQMAKQVGRGVVPRGIECPTLRSRVQDIERKLQRQILDGHGSDGGLQTATKAARRSGPLSLWPGRQQAPDQSSQDKFKASICEGTAPHMVKHGLCADSTLHRELGLWALDTANANSWATLFKYV